MLHQIEKTGEKASRSVKLPRVLDRALPHQDSFEQQELRKIARQIWQANKEARKYADTSNPAILHKYRIALRKCRCFLNIIKDRLPKKMGKRLESLLEALIKPTGKLRDLDTLLKQQSIYQTALESSQIENAEEIFRNLALQQRDLQQSRAAFFLSKEFEKKIVSTYETVFSLNRKLEKSEASLHVSQGREILRLKLDEDRQRFENEAKYLNFAKAGDAQIHKLRLKIKQIRYTAERVREYEDSNEETKSLITGYKRLQDCYGDYCDAQAHAKLILKAAAQLIDDQKKAIRFALNKIKLDRRIEIAKLTIDQFSSIAS